MPTFLRMMEILGCSLAGFLPFLLLLVYPFRNHLLLKGFPAVFLTVVMAPALLYHDLSAALGTAPVVFSFPLLRSVVFLVFSLLVIHASVDRVLLNSFSVVNLSILITAVADAAAAPYTLRWLLITLALQALLLIPYAVNLVLCLAPTLNCSDAVSWRFLWIAPAAGTAIALWMLYSGASASVLATVMTAAILAAAIAAALILYLTRTEMIPLFSRKSRQMGSVAAAPMSDPIQLHYQSLQTRMAESERSCQEMLLQVMSMEDDLTRGDYDQLRRRLSELRKQLSPDIVSTGNKQIDPVLAYYTRQAYLSGIKLVASIQLPELSAVSDTELAVLLGCLLDNALDACREQGTGPRRIAVATYQDDDLLQIGVKNTYGEPMDVNAEPLNFCRRIVARYQGRLTAIDKDGALQVVATLTV
ncbi:MAG: GHKL domain-containing protein [Firmicutes bacterium]|nr:GHKL domain-containing protein [Bacillota bacterium]